MFGRRRVGFGTAVTACCLSAAIAALAGSGASGSSLPVGPPLRRGRPIVIKGYGYSCQSTARTPNWACWYGKPYGPSHTPITTVFKGSRKMMIQSLRRPAISRDGGEWVTTVSR
jgi:hypothetical protein